MSAVSSASARRTSPSAFEDLKLTRDEDNNVKVMLDLNKDTLTSAPDYKLLNEQSVVEGSAKTDTDTKTY